MKRTTFTRTIVYDPEAYNKIKKYLEERCKRKTGRECNHYQFDGVDAETYDNKQMISTLGNSDNIIAKGIKRTITQTWD